MKRLTRLFLCFLMLSLILPDAGIAADKKKEDKKKEDEKPKWDVNNPPGPKRDITIDTAEGTWMNIDVSPDGKQIVFDLLGDIYTIPFGGGEAKAITQGIAWDMQPRYSPDGKWIAFTSDRSGGDNIWIMKRDGTGATQVTKEDFRLLTSPAWTPDSEYIAARKHFTSTRSAGAGEMWLYHRTGGGGVQMTKRPNEQKDAGEPSFSPDGKYLFYSQDVTPGPFFQYNKDPNTQIYAVQRLDRESGESETYISGPGGSIRPTPSHNGRKIAFIRRIRYKTVLHVVDVDSGKEEALFDGLDRDLQETWAIHGVYPVMSWTPDDSAIVFWSAGKIQKIDVASKKITEIPFHIKDTRKIQEAVRFPVSVAPDKFDVKMLRWVQVSPTGQKVLYQALGHIYVRDLPSGTPKRLTAQTDHYEFYPSFSRDGNWIVYTTWDDQKLGTIRVVSAQGGEGKTISINPGHYVEPAFTPDGKRIVYRTVAGGYLTSPTWAREQAVYWIPVEGGQKPVRITKTGVLPHFGASNERVFLLKFEPGQPSLPGKSALISIELDGSDERTHIRTDAAAEFRVSPDEKWVAFVERFQAHIMPFVRTGGTIEIAPDSKAIPMAKATKDAGEYLHWSGDSRKLHWALGPELFTRDLKESFAFMEGAPEKLPDPPEKGVNIGFTTSLDKPAGAIALTGGKIITMRGDEVIENGTVLIEGNRIKQIGSADSVKAPADARKIDVSGKTLAPGLIDVHWHGAMGEDEITPEQNWNLYASLAFGVTTAHDPSNDNTEVFAASEMARAGMITAPRIFSTGTILYGATAPFTATINSLDDARSHLRRMKAIGAWSVKSYNQPRRDQRQQVIAAARELNMMVVPEGGSLFTHNMNMIVDGHTGVEHSIPLAKVYSDTYQLWTQSKTGYTPTLVVGYGGLWGENYWYQMTDVWKNERLLTFVPRQIIDPVSRRRTMVPEDEFNHISNARIAAELARKGVIVNLGAHGQREGLAAHWEMWMFQQGGMTPMESLRAATLNGARYLGMDRDIGSLEPGKLADIIVMDKDPLADIRNTESVRYTIINGRVFDAATMNEVAPSERKRAPFFWQE